MSKTGQMAYDEQLAHEERVLNAYLQIEGISREDFDLWPLEEQLEWHLAAADWHEDEKANNGQFGVGA